MMPRILLTIILFLAVASAARAESAKTKATKEVLDKLRTQDPEVRPSENEGPTNVTTNLMIRGLNVDDVNMKATFDITFRMQWKDSRLSYSTPGIQSVTLKSPELAWLPDAFFKNAEVSSYESIHPEHYLRVDRNGTLLYSSRKKIEAKCPMNLRHFPYDTQTCSMSIASYGYNTEDITFLWKSFSPVQVTRNLNFPSFFLSEIRTDYCNSKTNTGEYSCLKADFEFTRETSWYILIWYVPSAMFVIVALLTLIVPSEKFTEKIVLCIVALIAQTAISYVITNATAHVSYTRSVDIYTGMSTHFIFIMLVHNIIWQIVYSRRSASADAKNLEETMSQPENLTVGGRIFKEISSNKFLWSSTAIVVYYIIFLIVYFEAKTYNDFNHHVEEHNTQCQGCTVIKIL